MSERCGFCTAPLDGQIVYEKKECKGSPTQLTFGYECCIRKGHHSIFCSGPCYLEIRADDKNLESIYKFIDTVEDIHIKNSFEKIAKQVEIRILEPIIEKIEKDLVLSTKILGRALKIKNQ